MREINVEDNFHLQMDNARIHWTLNSLYFYKYYNITIVDWLAYSRNLNLIKNINHIWNLSWVGNFEFINQLDTELV